MIIIVQSKIMFSNSRTAASAYKIWIDPPYSPWEFWRQRLPVEFRLLKKAPGIFWSIRHAWKHLARDGLVTSWRQGENWTNHAITASWWFALKIFLPTPMLQKSISDLKGKKLGQFHLIRSTKSFDPSVDLQVSSPYQAKWIKYDRKQRRGTLHILA